MKEFLKKTTALDWVCFIELGLMFYGFCDAFRWNLGAVLGSSAVVIFTGTIINISHYPGLEKLAKTGFSIVVGLNVLLLWTHVRNFSKLLDGDQYLPGNLSPEFWGFYTAVILFTVNIGALVFVRKITAAKNLQKQKETEIENARLEAERATEVERTLALERTAERNRQAELEKERIRKEAERDKLQAETERLKILKQHEAEQAERNRQFAEKQQIRESDERKRLQEPQEAARKNTEATTRNSMTASVQTGTINPFAWRKMTEAEKRKIIQDAEAKAGSNPTNKRISEMLGISERTIQDLRKAA